MGYEYGAQSPQFDIPNPHRVENVFLHICSGLCVVVAITALIACRHDYAVRAYQSFGQSLAVGLTLLIAAVVYATQAMRQMRFFFGRGQPADIVPHLEADVDGYIEGGTGQVSDARILRETIRQNAITYPIPSSPIDTLLYSLVRNLIYSPRVTQSLVRTQFRNIVALFFLMICFIVSIVGIGNHAAIAWVALFYFAIITALVLRPLASGRADSARFDSSAVVAFVTCSIIGPVILASVIPRNSYPFNNTVAFTPIAFAVLFAALAVSALLLTAGIRNTVRPNTIAAAPYLETPSMNATPAQLFTELAREMQRLWVEQVPNRTYMRIPPLTEADNGAFDATLIEETQPLAQDIEPLSFRSALASETTRWRLTSDIVGTGLTIIGALMLLRWGIAPHDTDSLLYGLSMLVVGAYAFRGANRLWRRFEFKSRLYWIECNGNYSRASTKVGSFIQDRIHTSRVLINVETMTLRVWAAEVDSVAFDTDRARDIVSLRGLPHEAERVCKHLAAFGTRQASVVVPTSSVDLERLALMEALTPKSSSAEGLSSTIQAALPQMTGPTATEAQAKSFARSAAVRMM